MFGNGGMEFTNFRMLKLSLILKIGIGSTFKFPYNYCALILNNEYKYNILFFKL